MGEGNNAGDRNNRFLVTTLDVNVRLMMSSVIEIVHHDDDSVEHRNDRHIHLFIGLNDTPKIIPVSVFGNSLPAKSLSLFVLCNQNPSLLV